MSLSPSVLDFTRRTQFEAQAYRTAVKVAELGSQAKEATRDDAVDFSEEAPEQSVYPATEARRNVTVRRSRRLSGKPEIQPRTPEDVLKRRSQDRPRDKDYEEQGFRSATAFTYRRNHGEDLQGGYRVVPYSQDDPDEGHRYAGRGTDRRVDHQSDRVKEENQSSSKDDDSDAEGDEQLPLFLRRLKLTTHLKACGKLVRKLRLNSFKL